MEKLDERACLKHERPKTKAKVENSKAELQEIIVRGKLWVDETNASLQSCKNVPLRPSTKSRTISAEKTGPIKVENKSSFATPQRSSQRATHPKASHQLQDSSTHPQRADSRATTGYWSHTDSATAAAFKQEHKPPTLPRSSQRATNSMAGHRMQDSSTHPRVNTSDWEHPVVRPKKKEWKDQTLSQVKCLVREHPTTTDPATVVQPKGRGSNIGKGTNSTPGHRLQDFSTDVQVNSLVGERPISSPWPTAVQLKEDREDHAQSLLKELAGMFSATTTHETAVRPKKKHREEQQLSQVKLLAQKLSAANTARITEVQPKEKDREDPKLQQNLPDTRGATTQMNPVSGEATTGDPKIDSSTGTELALSVKELARMFSATTSEETADRRKGKHREEPKLSQVKLFAQKLSAATAQETAVHPKEKDKEVQNLTQVRPNRNTADTAVKDKIQTSDQNVAQGRSSVKARKGSSKAEWLEITSVFSEVVRLAEEAKQKSLELSLSTLRTTTSTMMEQIQQNLDKLSTIELKRISKFAVDVKLDPASAHRCLVLSPDLKLVRDGGKNQIVPDTPQRFDMFGSIVGLNRLTSGKSYWEVEVSNKTGWDLGVARQDANRKGKLSLSPNNGYWVTVHYEDKKYAALTEPPTSLPLTEKPQTVGVFVDYDEGLVSFYNVTARSHIYSFTECSFSGEILPYFSPHLKQNEKNSYPLIISTVRKQ
ncbi:uncharacterized protein LOC117935010 [Etheostoma cragini]|uniref:uncharacterized protein LOC117935010 n=1 Tax=Etheostoma cragini TaxID=417921 RepID=UPI00155E421B|nr:uncharacterized protein LOC117935010 [Etheostoma cragini]